MEFGYNAQYKQPFTLEEAAGLDVEVITEEIARLQHSIAKLKETQEILAEELKTAPDPELQLALEENNSVIASQEERIRILNMALRTKGIVGNSSHYALPSDKPSQVQPVASGQNESESDEGVYL